MEGHRGIIPPPPPLTPTQFMHKDVGLKVSLTGIPLPWGPYPLKTCFVPTPSHTTLPSASAPPPKLKQSGTATFEIIITLPYI